MMGYIDSKNLPPGWEIQIKTHYYPQEFAVIKNGVVIARGANSCKLIATYFCYDTPEARQIIQDVLDKKTIDDDAEREARNIRTYRAIAERKKYEAIAAKTVLFGEFE